MENQTAIMEQTVDENQYQAPNPKTVSSSNVPAGGAERKWQLISLVTGVLLVMAISLIVWLAVDASATSTQQGKLESENQSLREQLNIAGTQITGLKNDMETLLNRNVELANGNPDLKSQAVTPAAVASRQSISRTGVTKKGTNSSGTTKEELIASMGEPDRVYNSRGYEQLVYFGQKPGRFWLIGGHVVQVGG
jgi:glucose/arabinose dehydrogenase